MKPISITAFVVLLGFASLNAQVQDVAPGKESSFDGAAATLQQQLEDSVAELNQLRELIVEEKLPLSRELSDLEADLVKTRLEYQQASRLLDSRTLDLSNLKSEIKSRKDEVSYLANLLNEYIRNFESRLHIAELQRYETPLDEAKLAAENTGLSDQEILETQARLLNLSLDRLQDAVGGTRFEGTSVDPTGLVNQGTFVQIGPAALFRSGDGQTVGTAEQRIGSLEPATIAFADPLDTQAASQVIETAGGYFPLDPTLGNAHKVEAIEETLWEHIQKGGTVMVPIFVLAGAAFLVVIFKWISMAFIRKPSPARVNALLEAVGSGDEESVQRTVKEIKGPVGKMLAVGVKHIKDSRDLIEEVMYETVLKTRLKLNSFLPFIAICAASAPLLGLLGTVTGIINTFKLITLFGSGDVKTLSGGISEALITTEFGLIIAIPSLLLHAFLSRKARGIVSQMETAAIAFVNEIGKAQSGKLKEAQVTKDRTAYHAFDPDLVKMQVKEILDDALEKIKTSPPETTSDSVAQPST